jgi:hypothetical protein
MQFIGRHKWLVVLVVLIALGLTAHMLNLSGLVFDMIRKMHGGG